VLLDEHWAAAGLDPAHPHAPLYRTAINEIARRLAAKKDTAASNVPLPGKANPVSVVLSEGTITVQPDRGGAPPGDSQVWECHTLRRPPKEGGKIEARERFSLLREAIEQQRQRREREEGLPASDARSGTDAVLHLRYLQAGGEPVPIPPGTPAQRKKHLAAYEDALRGVRLRVFPAVPKDDNDCPACPYFFVCPT
jgi:hypothetical protein